MMDRIEDVNAPKTLEFWTPDEVALAFLGFVSGLLSTASLYLVTLVGDPGLRDAGFFVVPGAWFAVAVMLPFQRLVSYWWPRTLLAIAVCSCAHALSFNLIMAQWRASATPPAWE